MMRTPLSPDLCALKARDYLLIRGLRDLIREKGRHLARQDLNRRSKGNVARLFDKYGEFLEIDPAEGSGISETELYERYRESVSKQLAA